ncbi:hypothetical protein BOTNAR_0367g00030 [Botryotinia narcissicola]|uniref:Uncharacterized protein n=1 Tax=Botryotinia narcissicola TaxID=278944 RepID=A0A4Z1HQH8_9HELO|nr:hypothetical protein BOTNAR_0367g00030 [Botryotinia narcissicola]
MWGRYWGLVEGIETIPIDSRKINDITLLDTVDEDHEIPGLKSLTVEILGRIHEALDEWKRIGQKYGKLEENRGTASATEFMAPEPRISAHQLLAKISAKHSAKEKEVSSSNSVYSKLRWALKDKTGLEELLSRLTNLNDSPQKLLPRREKNSLMRGLIGEIVGAVEESKLEYGSDSNFMEVELEHLIDHNDTKSAEIILLRHENNIQIPELLRNDEKNKVRDSEGHTSPTPFTKSSTWAKSGQKSMQIPTSDFASFSEPKLQYYHANKSLYVPLPRTMAVYAPLAKGDSDIFAQHFVRDSTNEQFKQVSTISLKADSGQTVLIEWRLTAAETHHSELSPEDLILRRHHIAHLLHRTFDTDAGFRVLDCIGYTTTTGHTPEGGSHELVGFVYRITAFASLVSLPVTLKDLLSEAYASESPKVPSLNQRFKLSHSLATALYQLRCAGWVHRKISSYNIIFFRDQGTGEVDLSHPFLMYVHIARIIQKRSQSHFPRFRPKFDIYSLGIVLLELGFWEPIMTLATPSERVAMTRWEVFAHKPRGNILGPACSWWKTICEVAKKELAPEMGDA